MTNVDMVRSSAVEDIPGTQPPRGLHTMTTAVSRERRAVSSPLQCFSMVGLGAPCDGGLAVPAGAAAAGIVGLLLWLKDRQRRPRAGA